MKKLVFIFAIGFVLFLVSPLAVFADFESSYQNLLNTYERYRTAHNDYLSARNRYLQFDTLASKTEALEATRNFLVLRDDVTSTYISMLRERITDESQQNFLNDEALFIVEHRVKSQAVSSLEDAVKVSDEVEKRHISFQVEVKKMVGTIVLKKVKELDQRFITLENDANSMIQELKGKGFDVTTQDRWLLDARNKRLLAEEKLLGTQQLIDGLKAKNLNELTTNYNKVQFSAIEANQYLREGLSFLSELTDSIKYGKF